THTEAHPFVGRNLAPLILNKNATISDTEPIYFMTDDDPSKSLNSLTLSGTNLDPVTQPSHIETVIVKLPTGRNDELETWKYSRYFDNPQFWSTPGCSDENNHQGCSVSTSSSSSCNLSVTS